MIKHALHDEMSGGSNAGSLRLVIILHERVGIRRGEERTTTVRAGAAAAVPVPVAGQAEAQAVRASKPPWHDAASEIASGSCSRGRGAAEENASRRDDAAAGSASRDDGAMAAAACSSPRDDGSSRLATLSASEASRRTDVAVQRPE